MIQKRVQRAFLSKERRFQRAAAVLTLLALTAAFQPARATGWGRPNIVMILADDLGWGDLSCYWAKDLRTPNIDRLAAQGVRCTGFYANCSVCSPTRASLLTGRYPELAGVPGVIRTHPENSWGWLSPSVTLLPQVLKKVGYHTAIIGKWHLGLEPPNTPLDRGFDFFHGFLGDMMDDYYTHLRHGINYMRLNRKKIDPQGHATDLFTKWACDYLRGRAGAKRPFFLYLAYNAPHVPIQPPPEWVAKVKAREPGISERRARLAALIEHLDYSVGQVLKTLKELGIEENTLVLFSSDNGGQLNVGANNGPWRDGKGSMYEGGLRVPLIARWPGRIPAGLTREGRGATMDLFATMCDAAGVKPPASINGVSLLPALFGKRLEPLERDLFFVRREGGNAFGGKTINAVRRGRWKLLQNSPWKPLELYDLETDPREERNLADARRREFNALAAALRRQIQRGGAVPWQPPSAMR